MKAMRTAWVALACALLVPGLLAAGAPRQEEQKKPSLGEIARRLREQKKEQPKPKQVWDNDNLPPAGSEVNVIGQPPAPEPAAKAEGSEKTATKEGAAAAKGETDQKLKDIADTQAKLLDAKKNLEDLQRESDLLQRQYNLDSQQFYGKPEFSSDKEGQAKINAEAAQLDAKRQEVSAAQQTINDLQQKLEELNSGSTGEKTEQPAPQPPSESEQEPPSA